MNVDLLLAKIIKSILSGDLIDASGVIANCDHFPGVYQKVELCNAIVVPHKKRYLNCATQEEKDAELKRLERDYRSVFNGKELKFISVELVRFLFIFMMSDRIHELSFREVCVGLIDAIKTCDVSEIKYFVYLKLIQSIVHGSLYGSEPFDSILMEAIEFLDNTDVDSSALNRIMFLE